jgi:hypothetical protein
MDVASVVWGRFFEDRHKPLGVRFPGIYRAQVVETNDPLCMNRIRFKCPELHDFDLKPEECPWASSASRLGGVNSGEFAMPCIGDWVWIEFEKQHPYGPVWIGHATPTLRGYYPLARVSSITPLSYDSRGQRKAFEDYDVAYLPKDGRPMSYGYQDRYGNIDYSSSIGYFPKEHEISPPPIELDPGAKSILATSTTAPIENDPDKKYLVRATRYGHIHIMGDQGYTWKKDGDFGEITNDQDKDRITEIKRYLYLQKLLNEDHPKTGEPGTDQRRIESLTRYGHKIECRDVGWAQPGPVDSKCRPEYGEAAYVSRETEQDQRWIKIRTKGGMLFQAYDKGFDPQEDNYVKRFLLDEVGTKTEKEDEYWKAKDARFMRLVTRHGYKIVLDDRGSDSKESELKPDPTGNGILMKGRRYAGCQRGNDDATEIGYYFEFNENDSTNHSTWGSPLGQTIEINDRHQYMMMSTRLGQEWPMSHQGIKENEFIGKPIMSTDAETGSHHLKLDLDNEYIRLKTRAGKGNAPYKPVEISGVDAGEANQGLEARDGSSGDGPWVELVDCQERGFWFSKKLSLGVWRSGRSSSMFQILDDTSHKIVIQNNEVDGTVEIFCANAINIIAGGDLNLQAGGNLNLKSGAAINLSSSSARVTIQDFVRTDSEVHAELFRRDPGANNVFGLGKSEYTKLSPGDRAKTYNSPFDTAPREDIEHPI